MILITSGHERSLSHEILLKALSYFSKDEISKFKLFTDSKLLVQKANELKIPVSVKGNDLWIGKKKLTFTEVEHGKTLTTSTLEAALKEIKSKDIQMIGNHNIHFNEFLMVGNDAKEDAAAKSLGIKVALLKKNLQEKKALTNFRPDYLIDNLIEIKNIINNLNDN